MARIVRVLITSKPFVGSSRRTVLGAWTSARAMATLGEALGASVRDGHDLEELHEHFDPRLQVRASHAV